MSFEPAEHLAHEAEYQNAKAARSCFKKFVFILFVCLLFFQESSILCGWRTSALTHMTKSSGFEATCYTSCIQVKQVTRE